MLWLRPETDAGSAGKQPARDTGVAADDRPCGGLPAPAASRRKPPGQAIGVVPCLRKSWGEAPAGRQGGKAHLPANNGGWLPCRLPATLRSSPPPRSGQLACRSLPIPSKPQNSPNFGLTSKTEAFQLRDERGGGREAQCHTASQKIAGRWGEGAGLRPARPLPKPGFPAGKLTLGSRRNRLADALG